MTRTQVLAFLFAAATAVGVPVLLALYLTLSTHHDEKGPRA